MIELILKHYTSFKIGALKLIANMINVTLVFNYLVAFFYICFMNSRNSPKNFKDLSRLNIIG